MLSQEQNDLLTRVGPGTPGGNLLRQYWQPIALSRELPTVGTTLPIDILGEELVLFRDDRGRVGLLDRHCCHRGTDLSFGRVENGGLRCLYHGWLYDVTGRCMEQPAEPKDSTYKDKVRQPAYPVVERAGAFFAYMGPGEPPEFPAYDLFTAPPEHTRARKIHVDCNYLQANEGNYDPAHVGFLHRVLGERKGGLAFGDLRNATEADLLHINPYDPPRIEVEHTKFGMRIFQSRPGGPGKTYLRVTAFGMPNFSVIAGPQGGDGHIGSWHVPIDDYSHWRISFVLRRDRPLDAIPDEATKAGGDSPALRSRSSEEFVTEFHHSRGRENRYRQDRNKMNETFSGMGPVFGVHDAFATESQGRIQDRRREHLATSDLAIVAARRLMLRSVADVQNGKDPVGVVRNPADNYFPDLMSFDALVNEGSDYSAVVEDVVGSVRQQAAE